MSFRITITEEAEAQLRWLPVRDQRVLESTILTKLQDQPATPSRAIKKLRPNPLVGFELRVQDLRVLYNVDESEAEVLLLVVGRKQGNKLIVAGREFHGHQDHPAEPPGDESAGHAQ